MEKQLTDIPVLQRSKETKSQPVIEASSCCSKPTDSTTCCTPSAKAQKKITELAAHSLRMDRRVVINKKIIRAVATEVLPVHIVPTSKCYAFNQPLTVESGVKECRRLEEIQRDLRKRQEKELSDFKNILNESLRWKSQ